MSQDQTPGTGMMGMHHMHDMSKMHEQMVKDMQADLDSMRSNLQKMKDQIGKVSDRATRDQLQLNIDMWQSFVDQMDKHVAAMKKMMNTHEGPPAGWSQARTRSGYSKAVAIRIRSDERASERWD